MSTEASGGQPMGIDPRVDCVFKAVLGDPSHSDVLVDFLNAVLRQTPRIVSVEIINPVQPPNFLGDDLSSLDLLARDASGRLFQVDMQNFNQTALKSRMLYNWASVYVNQKERGDKYQVLRPVISIWLLGFNTVRRAKSFHHTFMVSDLQRKVRFSEHLQIHTLELSRWQAGRFEAVSVEMTSWMRFFTEAKDWIEIPPEIKRQPLERAMDILKRFRDNPLWSDAYRLRMDANAMRATIDHEFNRLHGELADKDAALAEKDTVIKEKDAALADKDAALAEKDSAIQKKDFALEEKDAQIQQLLAQLKAQGIESDAD